MSLHQNDPVSFRTAFLRAVQIVRRTCSLYIGVSGEFNTWDFFWRKRHARRSRCLHRLVGDRGNIRTVAKTIVGADVSRLPTSPDCSIWADENPRCPAIAASRGRICLSNQSNARTVSAQGHVSRVGLLERLPEGRVQIGSEVFERGLRARHQRSRSANLRRILRRRGMGIAIALASDLRASKHCVPPYIMK